jgi:signal transduction histidine kinase
VTWRRSLSFRLVLGLMIAQLIAVCASPAIRVFYFAVGIDGSTERSWNNLAGGQARKLVIQSLQRGADGSILIAPTPALREYHERHPSFLYAAYDKTTKVALAGSSGALTDAAAANGRFPVRSMRFHIAGDADENSFGLLSVTGTTVGQVIVAVYGYVFDWREFYYYFVDPIVSSPESYAREFAPLALITILMAWLIVRRGLAPLRAATEKATRIDLVSLGEPIPESEAPYEVASFVMAVNEAMARVQKSVEAQNRFMANAAHELRTPITVLCARIDNPVEATFMRDVKRDARRIKTLAEQLLSAAHMSNHKGAIGQKVDLGKLVLTMVMDYLPLAVANDKDLALERPAEPIIVLCDPYALERVVVNLIENACRAEPIGGTVLVRVCLGATIEVVDHGEGVAAEDRERIFEPFWRKSNAAPGAGLGLAISREIIEHLGGCISVTETPSGGATFAVTLPQRFEAANSRVETHSEELGADRIANHA